MKMKKMLAGFLAAALVFTALPTVALAETEETTKQIPNLMGAAMVDNLDCKEIDSLKGLQLELTVTNDEDPTETFTIPLQYDEELDTYYGEAYQDQGAVPNMIDKILAQQEKTSEELGLDDENLLENAGFDQLMELSEKLIEGTFSGYTVTLNGLGEDSHFKAELFAGGVDNGADLIALFEMMLLLFGPEEGFAAGEEPQNYTELLDYIAKNDPEGSYEDYQAALKDSGFFETDEIDSLTALFLEADQQLEAARNGTYPMQLSITMNLLCDCPVMVEYAIAHQYLIEKDGELVEVDFIEEGEQDDWGFYILKGEEGQVIRGKDYVKETYDGKNEDYQGRTFTFLGSYDDTAVIVEDATADWSDYQLEEYTLSEDYDYTGLVLRYVLKEEPKETVKNTETGNKDVKPVAVKETKKATNKVTHEDGEQSEVEAAPATGDKTPVGLYVSLLAAVVTAMAWLTTLRRKAK